MAIVIIKTKDRALADEYLSGIQAAIDERATDDQILVLAVPEGVEIGVLDGSPKEVYRVHKQGAVEIRLRTAVAEPEPGDAEPGEPAPSQETRAAT